MPDKNYLCFEKVEDTIEIAFNIKGTLTVIPSIEYSFDGNEWVEYTFGTSLTLTDKIYFRGDNESFSVSGNYITFTSTGFVKASGNIMSLLDKECESVIIPTSYCFSNLFNGCSGLLTAPELPATTLTTFCYFYTFRNCTSLFKAPELPATTLDRFCYYCMFYGCSSLAELPNLPATNLPQRCYALMFWNCASIKVSETKVGDYRTPFRVPTVGTAIENDSLYEMFSGTGGTFTDTPLVNTTYYVVGGYALEISYDNELGQASFERSREDANLVNLYVVSTITKFNGWYINDNLISYDNNAQYLLTEDSVIEARFEPIWEVDTSVIGDGSIQYTRQTTNRNIVSFSVIPEPLRHFGKYIVNDVEYFETPLTLTLTEDTTAIAYFEEDDKYHISATTNISNGSVYVSHNDDYATYTSTLWARPFPNYVFDKWNDGNKDNPRTISVDKNITLIAEYTHIQETNGIYQYRCYVKDQLDLEAPPKAFMVVDTFDIKEDYLTKANSTINVLKINTNINNGDVIVVYNPKGETIYQGVITSISDNKITTSQMQSFYKGLWIYNVKPQTYLEDELKLLLQDYADGKLYKSTYTDTLVAQRLGGITIQSVGATQVNLPTDLDKDDNEQLTQYDMEQFIYKLYQDYGIIFDFTINFSGTNYVNIKVPTYSPLSIGNNHYAIQNLTPIQKVEETNRLVIYSSQKVYRTTYVATTNGIVEQPSSLVNRFNITNTKVVFSDDSVDTLIASNLPTSMYNHKVNFDLFLKNSLYEYDEFKLGMPLEIYYNGTDYYNSVLTGRNMKKASNQNVNVVSYVCGLVRSSITTKLTLKDVL